MPDSTGEVVSKPAELVRAFLRRVSRILLRGFVVIVPFVVLLFLFEMALGFVRGVLEPVTRSSSGRASSGGRTSRSSDAH